MKILVTGARGMLGSDLCPELAGCGHDVIETDVTSDKYLDITDAKSIRSILADEKPEWIVNCAAYTKVDACETDEETATLLNGTAPGYLAAECAACGIKLLHISTDYVFDGRKEGPYNEDDPVNPINAYGRSKLKGELAVVSGMKNYMIVRTQWLFGENGPNFVDTILKLARERGSIDVVNDQFGSPTYSSDLSKAIRLLIENDARGIFHICNRGKTSWFEFAKKAVELCLIPASVNPVSTEGFPRPAKRPANSILSTKKFTRLTGRLMPPWQIALQEYLKKTNRLCSEDSPCGK
ncbi:MAG TPA: dTDP-4-dehydrorhamnose reductase [Desulfomonilia bacterium]